MDGFFPVAMKKRSFLMLATTPGPPNSFFMNLIATVDEKGNPKLRVVRSGQPCDACMKTKEPQCCIHNLEERPPWRDRGKEQRLAWVYGGHNAKFLTEQLGVVQEDSLRPFLPRYIAELRARPPYRDSKSPECIFIAADSSCGGKCEYALLAGYFSGKNHLVVWFLFSLFL